MKSLCKKSYEKLYKGKCYFPLTVGELYDVEFEYVDPGAVSIGLPNHRSTLIKQKTRPDWVFSKQEGYEHFYTPEETQNILRTELIDKILK
jgi:hypothetical protein